MTTRFRDRIPSGSEAGRIDSRGSSPRDRCWGKGGPAESRRDGRAATGPFGLVGLLEVGNNLLEDLLGFLGSAASHGHLALVVGKTGDLHDSTAGEFIFDALLRLFS